MKILILYYSLDGSTKLIGECIQKEIKADIEEIITQGAIVNPNCFMKYLWGGRMVMMNQIPEIKPLMSNLVDYDLIIIGTPVWAWTYSPPIGAFFEKYKIENKNIAIFCCHGGGPGKTLEKMREKLIGNNIISEADFREPIKKDTENQIKKAIDWIKGIIKDLT